MSSAVEPEATTWASFVQRYSNEDFDVWQRLSVARCSRLGHAHAGSCEASSHATKRPR